MMQMKVEVPPSAIEILSTLAIKNRRSIPREIEVIMLRALGLWEETLPPNNIKLDKEVNER